MPCTAHQALGVLTASFTGGDGGVGEEEEEPKQLKRLFDCFLVVKKVSWLMEREEEEGEGREGVGEGVGGLLTMGTTLLAPALYIWKTGFLASRGCGWPGLPYLPGEGASWMQSLLPPPKRNSYNSPFVFCRNLELTSCYDAQGKEPRRMRSFSTLPRCQQGKFIWLRKVPARPLQPGPELCWLLGDRQPGPFPLLFPRPPSQPWQQPLRSHRHSQTAGRS